MNIGIVTYTKQIRDDLYVCEGYLEESGRVFTAFSKKTLWVGSKCLVISRKDRNNENKWYTFARELR